MKLTTKEKSMAGHVYAGERSLNGDTFQTGVNREIPLKDCDINRRIGAQRGAFFSPVDQRSVFTPPSGQVCREAYSTSYAYTPKRRNGCCELLLLFLRCICCCCR